MNARTTVEAGRSPARVLVVDDPRATVARTRTWLAELSRSGTDAVMSTWPRRRRSTPRGTVTGRDVEHFRRLALHGQRPVLIGTGAGADVCYRLLMDGDARGAVLIGAATASDGRDASRTGHGPLLLLDDASEHRHDADELREDGICDEQCLSTPHDTRRDALAARERETSTAHYITSWLAFHELATR